VDEWVMMGVRRQGKRRWWRSGKGRKGGKVPGSGSPPSLPMALEEHLAPKVGSLFYWRKQGVEEDVGMMVMVVMMVRKQACATEAS